MPFVLDNSVVCGWLLKQQATAYTEAMSLRLTDDRAIAPALLTWEYANVLRTAVKRGRLTVADAQSAIQLLQRLPIDIDVTPPDAALLLSLALQFELTSYDAAYLELGLRLRLPIATQDAELAKAAGAAGIGVFTP